LFLFVPGEIAPKNPIRNPLKKPSTRNLTSLASYPDKKSSKIAILTQDETDGRKGGRQSREKLGARDGAFRGWMVLVTLDASMDTL